MKAHYRTQNGRLTFEINGTSKELFKELAQVQELFESDTECGCCQNGAIRFRVRTVDGNDFYEMHCQECNATLAFGETKVGERLFARRKDPDGKPLPDHGWKVWRQAQPVSQGPAKSDRPVKVG